MLMFDTNNGATADVSAMCNSNPTMKATKAGISSDKTIIDLSCQPCQSTKEHQCPTIPVQANLVHVDYPIAHVAQLPIIAS